MDEESLMYELCKLQRDVDFETRKAGSTRKRVKAVSAKKKVERVFGSEKMAEILK